MVFLVCDPGSLHVQSAINKQREYKYVKALLFSQSQRLHQNTQFDFDQIMVRHRAKCIFIVCKVMGLAVSRALTCALGLVFEQSNFDLYKYSEQPMRAANQILYNRI